MHGRQTFKKSLQKVQRANVKKARNPSYIKIGNWRFEEDSDGNLMVFNVNSGEAVILVEKEVEPNA